MGSKIIFVAVPIATKWGATGRHISEKSIGKRGKRKKKGKNSRKNGKAK